MRLNAAHDAIGRHGPPATTPLSSPSATTQTLGARHRFLTFWWLTSLIMTMAASSCVNHMGMASGAPEACTVIRGHHVA